MSNYTKKLEVDCDDEIFSSGKIIISWKSEDQLKKSPLRVCNIDFQLQYGRTVVLRYEEVQDLINALETVKERLRP